MAKLCVVLFICASAFALASAATIRDRPLAIGKPVVAIVQTEKEKEFVPIVKSVAERKDDGSFVFSYEGADGTQREEVGIVKNAGTDEETLEVSGSYRYYDADGQLIEVRYTAGENGFVPHGTNIPQEITAAAHAAAEVARRQPVEVK
ncbi:endocuticle structural glycoprotein SgAbd-9 [Bactrocera dorsalis]|uniref:Endocuticle structural glycoprotein SgAbd-9 n=1 Tax=Bactrocera dorsalis TaxID=27457 RepID=A0A6I9VKP5_BACDO|nr:endocuticle structural glycoprotein SgAbd-9 [Bactrocera dorsalis]